MHLVRADSVSSPRRNHDQTDASDYRGGTQNRREGDALLLPDRGFHRSKLDDLTAPCVGKSSEDKREETGANENESKDANGSPSH